MTQRANAPVFVLIVLFIISLLLAAGGFYLFQKERVKAMDLAVKLQELTEKERVTSARLEESKKVTGELQLKLQDARTELDKVTVQLNEEKSAARAALANVTELKAQLQKAVEAQEDLKKKAAEALSDSKRAMDKLKTLQEEKNKLQERLHKMSEEEGVELGNIVVSPDPGAAAAVVAGGRGAAQTAGGIEGKVLVVNKDYNFAVINLGSQHGVAIGEVFGVYRGNIHMGDVKVEKVHESMAAAGFVNVEMKNRINEGDRVVQKSK